MRLTYRAYGEKGNILAKKSLFNRARDAAGGVLESRMVARMETEGRELTDEETRSELRYILETVPYAGLEPEDERKIVGACRRLLK